ncbi:hypothetical protein JCGZ_04108 [Jatropha curcas]|uniref:Tetraspanin-15 n=1 Tax=Jatropha curcas TaxID=180498 RepID=A0A067L2Q0_JATCU|nr:tetraspanin-15 [Jatropha curcas]KDP38755.1 hypothetical protein JCGZ_04108 [Jatropha curcas]
MAENTNGNPNPTPDPNPAPAPDPTPKSNPPEAVAVAVPEEASKPQEVTERRIMTPSKLMMKVKIYAGLLSIITFIISLPILASVVWLLYMKDYDCEKLLRLPKLQTGLGVGLLFLFLLSNAAVFFKARFPLPSFFVIMVPLIVVLTMGLALVGTYKMESSRIMASPMWFKEKVRNDNNWKNLKSCIYSSGVCDELAARSITLKAYQFSLKKLTSLESGCCNPPGICEMDYVNATYWRRSGDGVEDKYEVADSDCNTWDNNRTVLCYDCDTCRDGFVRVMESKWWKLGVFLIFMALLLIVCHLLLFVAAMWQRYSG